MQAFPPCPPAAELTRLLWGNVPAEQEGRLSKHLDECAACRQLLESLADGDGTLAVYRERAAEPEAELGDSASALQQAIRELKDRTQPLTQVGEDGPEDGLLLGFLSRPERADCLGRLGQYEVTEVIGRGGMGIVLKAFDPSLHRF